MGLQRKVRHGEKHQNQGEQGSQPFVAIDGENKLRRRYQAVLFTHAPDFTAQEPKVKRHEAGAESHDRKKGKPVAVAGSRGSEHREGTKVGGGQGTQKDQGAQAPSGQKIPAGAFRKPAFGQKAQGNDNQEIAAEHQNAGCHDMPSPKQKGPPRPQAGMVLFWNLT